MSEIRLHNTLTRQREVFEPLDASDVRMYVCGPTVYDRAHMGNARPAIVFDVLFRLLRAVYGVDHVTYVRNITDVDDKINARAAETGRDIADITAETTAWYLEDMAALGNLEPTHAPRATGYIAEMIAMIEGLLESGHAYVAEGHVLFDVGSYPDYGALSNRDTEDMIAGARVEVAPYKRDPMDFVMWKPSESGQPGWDSPWERGRPGWHIECSAMAARLLGASFDIHGGGNDLMFPHHENEIAQSACAHPGAEMAQVWMHNEMLLVEGRKMSKSLGNFFTVRDLLDRGVAGQVIRLVFLSTHYGKPMDWTETKRSEAEATLKRWYGVLHRHGYCARMVETLKAEGGWVADPEFLGVLANDLNTPGAIARLHVLAKGHTAPALAGFAHGLDMLGLVPDWDALGTLAGVGEKSAYPDWVDGVVERLLADRQAARAAKDWVTADRIRDVLNAAGVMVADVGGTASWSPGPAFDPSVLEDAR